MKIDNKTWAGNIVKRTDPSYKSRADIYNELVIAHLTPHKVWVDIGCGDNSMINDFGFHAGMAIGVDVKVHEHIVTTPFVCADLNHLPFAANTADLITLRFIVEHLHNIPEGISEVKRVLKPGGHIVIITTNIFSPFIFFPRLMPFRYKQALISSLYKIESHDVLPTGDWVNPFHLLGRDTSNLQLVSLDFVQDANYARKLLFVVLYVWHLLTKWKFLNVFRTCVIGVLKKSAD